MMTLPGLDAGERGAIVAFVAGREARQIGLEDRSMPRFVSVSVSVSPSLNFTALMRT
jgi:hypothetical protein